MEGMVLISKGDGSNGAGDARFGRPKRTKFCVRRNGKVYTIGIPKGLFGENDRVNFFMSQDGFAVNISSSGERAISGRTTSPHTLIPRVISNKMIGIADGTTNLSSEEKPNRTWFFPFSQFQPLQSTSGVLPVDDPTTLMEH